MSAVFTTARSRPVTPTITFAVLQELDATQSGWTKNLEAVDRRAWQEASTRNAVEAATRIREEARGLLVEVLSDVSRLEANMQSQKFDAATLSQSVVEQNHSVARQNHKTESFEKEAGNRIAILRTELEKCQEDVANLQDSCGELGSRCQQLDGENAKAEATRINMQTTNGRMKLELEEVRQRLTNAKGRRELLEMRLEGVKEREVELATTSIEISKQCETEKEALAKVENEESQLEEYRYELKSKIHRLKADAKNGFYLNVTLINLSDWEKDKQKTDSEKQQEEKERERLRKLPRILVEADVQAERLQELFQAIATIDVPDKRNASVKTMEDFATRFGKPLPGLRGNSYYVCKRITKQFTISA